MVSVSYMIKPKGYIFGICGSVETEERVEEMEAEYSRHPGFVVLDRGRSDGGDAQREVEGFAFDGRQCAGRRRPGRKRL
jgi:hypothetical protein